MSRKHNTLMVVHDAAHGYWLGQPWLVIEEEGEPAVASFATESEALEYVDELDAERIADEADRNAALAEDAWDARRDDARCSEISGAIDASGNVHSDADPGL